jgi:hypothetical protein
MGILPTDNPKTRLGNEEKLRVATADSKGYREFRSNIRVGTAGL